MSTARLAVRKSPFFSFLPSSSAFAPLPFAPRTAMALIEHRSTADIIKLVRDTVHEPQNRFALENAALLNVSRIVADGWKDSSVRFFSIGPYVFIVEQNEEQKPAVFVRPPPQGHDLDLLKIGVRQLLEILKQSIAVSKKLLLDCEQEVASEFAKVAKDFGLRVGNQFELCVFYMDQAQVEELSKQSIKLPDGYEFVELDSEVDTELVYETWSGKRSTTFAAMKKKIEHLPSIGVRNADGDLIAWEIVPSCVGKLNHLYTLPAYRGRGIGVKTELRMAQICTEKGLRVFKNVVVGNESVVKGSAKHPLWTQFKRGEETVKWAVMYFEM